MLMLRSGFDFLIGIRGGGGLAEKIKLRVFLRYTLLVSLLVPSHTKLILCSETVKNLYNL